MIRTETDVFTDLKHLGYEIKKESNKVVCYVKDNPELQIVVDKEHKQYYINGEMALTIEEHLLLHQLFIIYRWIPYMIYVEPTTRTVKVC